MSTLVERMRIAQAHAGLSEREWSVKANLSPGAVQSIVKRRNGSIETGARTSTVTALARAAGVDAGWLATGLGPAPSVGADPIAYAPESPGHDLDVRLDGPSAAALDAILARHRRALADSGVPAEVTPSTVVRALLLAEAARLAAKGPAR